MADTYTAEDIRNGRVSIDKLDDTQYEIKNVPYVNNKDLSPGYEQLKKERMLEWVYNNAEDTPFDWLQQQNVQPVSRLNRLYNKAQTYFGKDQLTYKSFSFPNKATAVENYLQHKYPTESIEIIYYEFYDNATNGNKYLTYLQPKLLLLPSIVATGSYDESAAIINGINPLDNPPLATIANETIPKAVHYFIFLRNGTVDIGYIDAETTLDDYPEVDRPYLKDLVSIPKPGEHEIDRPVPILPIRLDVLYPNQWEENNVFYANWKPTYESTRMLHRCIDADLADLITTVQGAGKNEDEIRAEVLSKSMIANAWWGSYQIDLKPYFTADGGNVEIYNPRTSAYEHISTFSDLRIYFLTTENEYEFVEQGLYNILPITNEQAVERMSATVDSIAAYLASTVPPFEEPLKDAVRIGLSIFDTHLIRYTKFILGDNSAVNYSWDWNLNHWSVAYKVDGVVKTLDVRPIIDDHRKNILPDEITNTGLLPSYTALMKLETATKQDQATVNAHLMYSLPLATEEGKDIVGSHAKYIYRYFDRILNTHWYSTLDQNTIDITSIMTLQMKQPGYEHTIQFEAQNPYTQQIEGIPGAYRVVQQSFAGTTVTEETVLASKHVPPAPPEFEQTEDLTTQYYVDLVYVKTFTVTANGERYLTESALYKDTTYWVEVENSSYGIQYESVKVREPIQVSTTDASIVNSSTALNLVCYYQKTATEALVIPVYGIKGYSTLRISDNKGVHAFGTVYTTEHLKDNLIAVPVTLEFIKSLNHTEREEFYYSYLYLRYEVFQGQRLEWYEKDWFKSLMQAISFAVAVITSVFTGNPLPFVMWVATTVISAVVEELLKHVSDPTWKAILSNVTAVAILTFSIMTGNFAEMTNSQLITTILDYSSKVVNIATNTVEVYHTAKASILQDEATEARDYYEEQMELLNEEYEQLNVQVRSPVSQPTFFELQNSFNILLYKLYEMPYNYDMYYDRSPLLEAHKDLLKI